MRPTADNSGHAATLRTSAQIAKATSYVRKTLYDIGRLYNMRVKLKWHLMYN